MIVDDGRYEQAWQRYMVGAQARQRREERRLQRARQRWCRAVAGLGDDARQLLGRWGSTKMIARRERMPIKRVQAALAELEQAKLAVRAACHPVPRRRCMQDEWVPITASDPEWAA